MQDLATWDLIILIQVLKYEIAANAMATWTGINIYTEINISYQKNECVDTINSTETNKNAIKWHIKEICSKYGLRKWHGQFSGFRSSTFDLKILICSDSFSVEQVSISMSLNTQLFFIHNEQFWYSLFQSQRNF